MEVPKLANAIEYARFFEGLRDERAYIKMVSKEPFWPKIENVYLDRAIHIGRRVSVTSRGVTRTGPLTSFTKGGKIYVDLGSRFPDQVQDLRLAWAVD